MARKKKHKTSKAALARGPVGERALARNRPAPTALGEDISASGAEIEVGTGKGWLFGRHAGLAAIANGERKIFRIVLTQAASDDGLSAEIKAAVAEADCPRPAPEMRDRQALNELLGPGAVHQGLAVQSANLSEQVIDDVIEHAKGLESACVVVLDQATDPRNIGAVMRSAAAFGALAVVVQDRHAPELTATLAKAASGAAERLPLIRVTNVARAIDELKQAEFWAIGFDGAATETLDSNILKGRIVLVLGAEGAGLRRLVAENCDRLVKINIATSVESLNLSNAAAVALYEFSRSNSEK
ncbi:MAG: 23S rRNA (guanosine(2251)-2'-O)-methyltransferase RlmB [Rhodospirillaceae bacterium]|nr:23S rRNA (guanosine(2251)-2'-O)-methyltransferase RlmB [Rhodospirillaceae bacterium]